MTGSGEMIDSLLERIKRKGDLSKMSSIVSELSGRKENRNPSIKFYFKRSNFRTDGRKL